jgi:poly [ADP-ribose] polymerase
VDVTNRFFTLIPHNFGTSDVPRLNNMEFIRAKLDMLENMMEIELAYEILTHEKAKGVSPIDAHYKSLRCGISTLDRGSQMWEIIKKYLSNTHGETHDQYALELEEVFTIDRQGEFERYEKFKDLHNRKLLWHGSRTSNFAGILSQGLRIAPKEAPVTGYMFGKGIYFADIVSKSANYCCTSPDNNTGFLLLCEVALGDMAELTDAKDTLLKPPRSKHSVKGVGKTEPDPTDFYELPTGTIVPYGKPVKAKVKNTSLLYNEYIVYDVAQVNITYLVQAKFKFKNRRAR